MVLDDLMQNSSQFEKAMVQVLCVLPKHNPSIIEVFIYYIYDISVKIIGDVVVQILCVLLKHSPSIIEALFTIIFMIFL